MDYLEIGVYRLMHMEGREILVANALHREFMERQRSSRQAFVEEPITLDWDRLDELSGRVIGFRLRKGIRWFKLKAFESKPPGSGHGRYLTLQPLVPFGRDVRRKFRPTNWFERIAR